MRATSAGRWGPAACIDEPLPISVRMGVLHNGFEQEASMGIFGRRFRFASRLSFSNVSPFAKVHTSHASISPVFGSSLLLSRTAVAKTLRATAARLLRMCSRTVLQFQARTTPSPFWYDPAILLIVDALDVGR